MREHSSEISSLGGSIVAVGTGDARYAAAFIREEQISFLVLVDDDAAAAEAVSLRTLSWFQLLHPRTWKATRATSKRGHHIHRSGKRVKQIGATFVIGAGDRIRYEHLDADSTDHAPIDAVLASLRDA